MQCNPLPNNRYSITVSSSSADTWDTCEVKAFLHYKQGARDPLQAKDRSLSAWFGNLLHNGIYLLRHTEDFEKAAHYMEEKFDIPPELQSEWYSLSRARELLAVYNKKYIPDAFKTLTTEGADGPVPHYEIHFNLPLIHNSLFTLNVEGYLDNVSYIPSDPGVLYNVDFKTSRFRWSDGGRASPWRRAQMISDQFVIYNWAMDALYGEEYRIGGTILDHLQTSPKQVEPKHLNRLALHEAIRPDPKQLELLKLRLTRLCEGRIVPIMAGGMKPIPSKPSACMMYGGCKFLRVCERCGADVDEMIPEWLEEGYRMEEKG